MASEYNSAPKAAAAASSYPSRNVVTLLFTGQSNADHYFTYFGEGAAACLTAFQNALAAVGKTGAVVNGSTSGSYLTKTANADAVSRGVTTNSAFHWWDDTTGQPGPMATQCLSKLAAAGSNVNAINHIFWAQGESDQTAVRTGVTPIAVYLASLKALFAWFRSQFPFLRSIGIQPLGTHDTLTSNGSWQAIRDAQHQMTIDSGDVFVCNEIYDIARASGDGVHYDGNYAVPGQRIGLAFAWKEAASVAHGGPVVGGYALSGTVLTLSIVHDKGTTLNGWNGTDVSIMPASGKTGQFRAFAVNGTEMAITGAVINAASRIQLTFASAPATSFTLYSAYDIMDAVDYGVIVKDNASPVQPLQSGNIPIVIPVTAVQQYTTGLVADWDATKAASYTTTDAQTLHNRVAAPADGVSQTAYDLYLGVDNTAAGDDPTFSGTPGDKAAKFTTDGARLFQLIGANAGTLIDKLPQTGANATDFTIVMAFKAPTTLAAADLCGTRGAGGAANPGSIRIGLNASGTVVLNQRTSTDQSATSSTTGTKVVAGATTLVGVAHRASDGAYRIWINSATAANTGTLAFAASSSGSTNKFNILRAGGNLGNLVGAGAEFYAAELFNTFLDDAAMAQVVAYLNYAHNRTYA